MLPAELARQLQERDRDIAAVFSMLEMVLPLRGSGSPEGVVSAAVGALFCRIDGGAGTVLYVKETGTGNTGWDAK
jgi:hypothetical protein